MRSGTVTANQPTANGAVDDRMGFLRRPTCEVLVRYRLPDVGLLPVNVKIATRLWRAAMQGQIGFRRLPSVLFIRDAAAPAWRRRRQLPQCLPRAGS